MAQLGTIRVQTDTNGTVTLPVFALGDSGSSVHEIWRVQTAGGTGFVPLVDPSSAAFPYVRIQTQNNGVLAPHNEATLSQWVDNFDDNDMAEYTLGEGSNTYINTQTGTVWQGSHALEIAIANGNNTHTYSLNGDGLDNYVFRSTTYRVYFRAGEVGSNNQLKVSFGMTGDTHGGSGSGYDADIRPDDQQVRIVKITSGSQNNLASTSASLNANTWYYAEIGFFSVTIDVTIYETDGTQVANVSADDTSHDGGGVGFGVEATGSSTAWFDAAQLQ